MSSLNHVRWIEFPSNRDNRGILTSIESAIDIPFDIKRVFYMHHIVSDRGGHAHRDTDQVIIAIAGKFVLELSDGMAQLTFELNDPTRGLYIPRMIFIRMYNFTPDAVCCVLASTHYDITKSLRTWDEYIRAVKNQCRT